MSSSEGEQLPEERKDGAQVHDNRSFTLVHKTIKKTVNVSYLKESSLWNKIQYLNFNIFRTLCYKPLIFQTQII